MKKIISKLRKTRDYENLESRLGKDLGRLIYTLVNEAEKVDKELDIVHKALTELYEQDRAYPVVKKALDEIERLR